MACERFLNFKPIDEPSWRKHDKRYEYVPTANEMIKDIVKYHEMWERKKGKTVKNSLAEEKRKIVLKFLFRLQQDQGIGLNDQGTFEEIFNDEMNRSGRKRERSESEEDSSNKKTHKELLKNQLVNEQASNKEVNDQESLPSSLETEDYFLDNSHDKGHNEDQKRIESINLLRGYRHLKNELNKLSGDEQSAYVGEIDVETCIQECHEILMRSLLNKTKTQPGKFSVLPRSAKFDGKDFFYPSYATEDIAYQAVDTIVLEYNKMVREISKIENKHEKLEL